MVPFFVMWYVYILYSESIDRYYSGVTDRLDWRLKRHNMGWGRFTKRGIPWKIVQTEYFSSKSDALKRERELKKMKSRKYIETLINN
ncbi:MAG: GIY-YIG nuclease family protein [Calditrichaceae bacterium]|nr:GIY-YIG nuclease family protein [Calditrichaceae bacterium]